MYHEATACHVTGDIVDLLSILLQVLKNARTYIEQKKGNTGFILSLINLDASLMLYVNSDYDGNHLEYLSHFFTSNLGC